MKEATLINYFNGLASPEVLQKEVNVSAVPSGTDGTRFLIEDFEKTGTEFVVQKQHLLKLCDDVLAGFIKPEACEMIAFCCIASDTFPWPDNETVVQEVLHMWGAPEINYPLILDNMNKFKILLESGKDTFTKDDLKK